MRLKLTLARPTGLTSDIEVTADAAATVGAIAETIARLDPAPLTGSGPVAGSTLSVRHPQQAHSQLLDPDSRLSDARLASGATITTVDAQETARADRGPVLALLKVIDGPATGAEYQLRRGSIVLGRDPGCDFVIDDGLVSKRHVRVEVVDGQVAMVDLNSANAILLDGGVVTRAQLATGQTVLLGDSLIRVDIVAPPLAEEVTRSGPVAFNRSPAIEPRYPGEEFDGPDVPREEDDIPFPWLTFAAPLIMVSVLFFIVENKLILIFLAMSPLLMIGAWATQRLAARRKRIKAIERFDRHLVRLDDLFAEQNLIEREVRNAEAPPTTLLVDEARRLGPLLWHRRPEHWSFLNVRLGTADAPSRNTIKGRNRYDGIPEFQERLDAFIDDHRLIPAVAIAENLADAGCLGIAGDPTPAGATANALIAQIASLYSPTEVAFAAIVGPTRSAEFDWLKWLPHTGSAQSVISGVHLADNAVSGSAVLTSLEELIQNQVAKKRKKKVDLGPVDVKNSVLGGAPDFSQPEASAPVRPASPCLVVFICDDAPVDRARVNAVVERAVHAGILPIWLAEKVTDLPAACRTYVDVADGAVGEARVGYVRLGMSIEHVDVATLARGDAEQFAKELAGVADAGALTTDESDIPRSVSFLSLLGHDIAESADAVIDRWRQNDSIHDRSGAPPTPRRAGRLRALVGQASTEAMHLDLRAQGPHALVGGTTGSGKSEFLQAWVLGMAAEYSPDRVTFLFVDYKGGSAFAECVKLPHCVGLVTDLTPHLVQRALTSLRAELHFREHLLNRKKAKDLIELEKRSDPECPPVLVLVIDEFAALVGEVPEFVDGIVDIAQRGRSLGIHLIMATQRPAGVIKDNLRANTNLRIALRVADASDSTDVLGSPVAAHFDPSIPGRAVVRSGPSRLTGFQTGYAGGWTSSEPELPAVEIAALAFGSPSAWVEPGPEIEESLDQEGPNDTSRLVSQMILAAERAELPPPRKPWLDELASVYDSARLRQRTDEQLLIGIVDDASTQSQYPVYFQPDVDGHMAVYGTSGSGKSVALRTLAVSAAITPRGGPVQVYAIDHASSGMQMLEPLPHVGAVVDGMDAERVARLLSMLRGVVERRSAAFASVRAGSIAEYRRLAGKPDEPRILVLLDGAGAFRKEYEYITGAGIYNDFLQILADGRAVGVHMVLSVDRPGSINPSISAALQRRLVLRLTGDADYMALDVPRDMLASDATPGRGAFGDFEAQVAVFGGSPNVAEQARAIESLAQTLRQRGVPQAPGIARLASDIPIESIAARAGLIGIGVADEDLQPVYVDPQGTFMLTGPPSSGRTTALTTMAASLAGLGFRTYYFGNRKSTVGTQPFWAGRATTIEEAAALAKEILPLAQEPASTSARIAIVVEGVNEFLSGAAEASMIELFKAAKRSDHFVLAESETSTWSSSWPLLAELKSGRRGFALQPDQQEGDLLFRTSFPRAKRSDFPAGRGYLVQAGGIRRVQLARRGLDGAGGGESSPST